MNCEHSEQAPLCSCSLISCISYVIHSSFLGTGDPLALSNSCIHRDSLWERAIFFLECSFEGSWKICFSLVFFSICVPHLASFTF